MNDLSNDSSSPPVDSLLSNDSSSPPVDSLLSNDSRSSPVDSVLSNDSNSLPVDSVLSNDSRSSPVDSVLSNDSNSLPVDSVLSNDSSSSPVDSVLFSDTGNCCPTPASVSECNGSCDDVVRSLQVLPEVTLNADFCGTSVRCVVDSAAGHSYIATSDVPSFNVSPKVLQDSFSVKVANGSIVRVGSYLPGLLTLLDHEQRQSVCSEYVHLRVLPSAGSLGSGEWPTILLGRDLMDQLSILVEARRCLRQGRVLYDYSSEVDNVRSLLVSDDRVLRLATADVGKPVEAAEFVTLSVDPEGQKKAEGYCMQLETRRPFADDQRGFFSTLVPLDARAVQRFPDQQTHQWQVCCPSPKAVVPSRRYADKMYSQLTMERRAQHDALVDQYLQRHHWSPAGGQIGPAAAEVFMVGGAGTSVKARLVCDFRPLNSAIPKSSSTASFLPVVMAAVRLARPHALVCADMHSAFYMLHLCDHDGCLNALQLRCGDGRLFESSRVCFGAGFGPEGLGCTLGRQRKQILQDPPARMRNSGIAQWVDDFILLFGLLDLANIYTIISVFLHFVALCGFVAALKKFAILVVDASRPEFQQLQPFIRPKATTLGVTLAFRPLPLATLSLSCDRQDRLRAAREILVQDHWSKTEIYAAAGGIGHDPVGLHGLAKPYCDATRKLFGGVFSKVSWNKPLREGDFSKDQWLAWSTLRQCLMSHVDDHLLCACDHSIVLEEGPVKQLILRTDASLSGGGVYIFTKDSHGNEIEIIKDATCWTKTQQHYHSNRRELLALHRGVCWLRRILHQMKDMSFADPSNPQTSNCPPAVIIQSDNSCSARWCLSAGSTLKVTAVERAAIVRLAAALGHELAEIKSLGVSYEVEHLSGLSNGTADELSRVLDIGIKGHSPLTLNGLLNRCIGGGLSDNHDDVFSLAEFLHSQISHDLCFEPCGSDCPRHIHPPEVPNDVSDDCVRLLQEVNPSSASVVCEADYVSRCFEIGSRLEADDSCHIISSVPPDQRVAPLLSDVLRLCWGVNQCCSLVAVYRWCWKVWLVQAKARRLRGRRQRARTQEFPDFPGLWDNDDLQFLLRADQRSNSHIGALPVCNPKGAGPYYRLDDLVYFRSNCSNGTVAYRAVVSDRLRDFVLRDIHRNYSHCGVTGMCARFIEAFFCRALRSSAVRVRRQCPCCARLDARFAWSLPIGGPYFNIRALLESPDYVSYSVVGIDFMTLAPGIKVLVCVCCATRHCTLLYLRKEDTRHALQGVRELSLSRGKPILLLSDRAAYFRSEEWSRSLRQQGIRAIHTASRAPWEGAVYERVNLEIRRVLKYLADIPKIQRLLKKFDPNSVHDTYVLRMLLLEIELMCNTRPIGMSSGSSTFDDHMEVISPDRLAYGFQRRLDDYTRPVPLATSTSSPTTADEDCPDFDGIIQAVSKRVGEDGILPGMVGTAPSRLSAIRNSFLSFHFQQLKDRSARQCGSNSRLPAHDFSVGEAVFVKNDKQIFGAHILELLPGKDKVVRRFRVRNIKTKRESIVSHANIAQADCVTPTPRPAIVAGRPR